MIKTVLSCFIWGWIPGFFNNRAAHPKQGCLPNRNPVSSWNSSWATNLGHCVHQENGISKPHFWKRENLKIFFRPFRVGKRNTIHKTADFPETYPQIAVCWSFFVDNDPVRWWISLHFGQLSTHQEFVKMPIDVFGPVCGLPCFPL